MRVHLRPADASGTTTGRPLPQDMAGERFTALSPALSQTGD